MQLTNTILQPRFFPFQSIHESPKITTTIIQYLPITFHQKFRNKRKRKKKKISRNTRPSATISAHVYLVKIDTQARPRERTRRRRMRLRGETSIRLVEDRRSPGILQEGVYSRAIPHRARRISHKTQSLT